MSTTSGNLFEQPTSAGTFDQGKANEVRKAQFQYIKFATKQKELILKIRWLDPNFTNRVIDFRKKAQICH